MGEISRRTFLKGSAALAGTTLLASLGLNASAEVAQSDEEKVVSAKTGTSPVSDQNTEENNGDHSFGFAIHSYTSSQNLK